MVGDPLVGAAEYEDLNELLEDHPVGCAGIVAAQRMVSCLSGSSAENWSQIGSMRHDGRAGMGSAPCSESVRNFPNDFAESTPHLQAGAAAAYLPTGAAFKLAPHELA